MRIPYKPIKSTGGDPLRPRRLRRCANQDRSRGRFYTSNRGGHATFRGSVRLDTSGTRPFVEAVLERTPAAAMRTSPSHVYYLGRFSRDGDFNRRRGLYSQAGRKMPGALSFPRPAATVSQARWRDGNNFRGGATNRNLSREDYGRLLPLPLQDLLQAGRKCRRRRGLGRSSKDLNRRSCPDYPARRGG